MSYLLLRSQDSHMELHIRSRRPLLRQSAEAVSCEVLRNHTFLTPETDFLGGYAKPCRALWQAARRSGRAGNGPLWISC